MDLITKADSRSVTAHIVTGVLMIATSAIISYLISHSAPIPQITQ